MQASSDLATIWTELTELSDADLLQLNTTWLGAQLQALAQTSGINHR